MKVHRGVVGIMLALLLLRPNPSEKRARFDPAGFALAATGLAAVLYALSNASISGWSSPTVLVTLIGGFSLLAVFVGVELIVPRPGNHPLVELRLFANGPFPTLTFPLALSSFTFFVTLILLP